MVYELCVDGVDGDLAAVVDAADAGLDRSGGVWLLATGIYCVIGVFGLFGLGWGGAWPIFVIAAGLSFILRRGHCTARQPDLPPRGEA